MAFKDDLLKDVQKFECKHEKGERVTFLKNGVICTGIIESIGIEYSSAYHDINYHYWIKDDNEKRNWSEYVAEHEICEPNVLETERIKELLEKRNALQKELSDVNDSIQYAIKYKKY